MQPHQSFILFIAIPQQQIENVRPIIPKPIWALECGSTVWPKTQTFTWPKISIQARKGNNPILSKAQGLDSQEQFKFGLSVLSLPGKSASSKIAVVQSPHRLCAQQRLREYRRRACLLKWEPSFEATFITFHSHLTIHLQLIILDFQLH